MRLNPSRIGSRRRDDGGFTLVFFALTIVVIMMFVALTIDVGAGLDERREDVSAADGGALAAAAAVGDVAKRDAAISVAETTLFGGGTSGLADATLDWNSCAGDAGALSVTAPSANCVTFNSTRSQVRVRIPEQTLAYFAPAAGLGEVTHSALAAAERSPEGAGDILPFAFPAADGTGHLCLRSNSGNADPPCDGATTGAFGEADFSSVRLGGCANSSNPLNDNQRFIYNMGFGVDHEVDPWDGTDRADGDVCQGLIAGPANSVRPSGGLTRALVGQGMIYGFTLQSVGYTGRLAQTLPGWWGSSQTTSINGTTIDNVPLQELLGANTGVNDPVSCRRDLFIDSEGADGSIFGNGANFDTPDPDQTAARDYIWATYGDPTTGALTDIQKGTIAKVLMERCFAHYAGETWDDNGNAGGFFALLNALFYPGYLDGEESRSDIPGGGGCANAVSGECQEPAFTRADDASGFDVAADIQLSPRFGYAPVLDDEFDSNNELEQIMRFRAVYISALCGNECVDITGAATGDNAWTHHPGNPVVQGGNNNFSSGVGDVTAWVFPNNMLPAGLSDVGAPFAAVNTSVALIL